MKPRTGSTLEADWMLRQRFDAEGALGFAELLLLEGWGLAYDRLQITVALGRIGRALARAEGRLWDGNLGRLRALDVWLAILAHLVSPVSDEVARPAGIERARAFVRGAVAQARA